MAREHHDSGLLARLLFAMPERRIMKWTSAEVDPGLEQHVAAIFERPFELPLVLDAAGEVIPTNLQLTPEAQAAWIQFYNEHAEEHATKTGDEAAAWSKLQGYAARFALVIHMVKWAAGTLPPNQIGKIDKASIDAGIALSRWFGNEAQRVYLVLGESDEEAKDRRLIEWIERKGGAVTARDLTHGLRQYRNKLDDAEADLTALAQSGQGVWEASDSHSKGGRPTRVFRLNSAATVTKTDTDQPRISSFGDGDSGDTPASTNRRKSE